MRAKQTAVRFTDVDLAILDGLQAALGISTRTDTIRLAIRKLAIANKVPIPKLAPRPKAGR